MIFRIIIHQKGGLGYSMQRYASLLKATLEQQAYEVALLGPRLYLSKSYNTKGVYKWLRYIDIYILFGIALWCKTTFTKEKVFYIVLDQALGLYVPFVKNKPHVIHCHDFIALKSTLGRYAKNQVGKTGKLYQNLIRKGFSQGKHFISISKHTQQELHQFLPKAPQTSAQIYNAVDEQFRPGNLATALKILEREVHTSLAGGFVLHVGGNTFYKNRVGVLQVFTAYKEKYGTPLKLVMIGSAPTVAMQAAKAHSGFSDDIYFLTKVTDQVLVNAYQAANVFLFPSLAEGFGYPIIEALACGCPVITTNTGPMTEVGGELSWYIPTAREFSSEEEWAQQVAEQVKEVIDLSPDALTQFKHKAKEHVANFRAETIGPQILNVYNKIGADYA
ncbi:glycosyltransferase [Flavobacterium sp. ASW18X]|uniref:glycosyltransferase n=1 Tax=Flavobacterium sp. ASW18X TaxID=2572595 RepID=UPI0010AE9C1C|nr:glycosyltransferase [Flavobacterium sp. ASW18X]TKD65543.1 glycosyltransferase family 4 protein [Flavobacterium sp. ASW18X]